MSSNETNLHRAARALQRSEGISYQQARQRLLAARAGRPAPAQGRADDGERRCTECGDSFNLAEGGTDLSTETGGGDGYCLWCESAVPPDVPTPVVEVEIGRRFEDLSPASCAGAGTVTATRVGGNPNLARVTLDGGGDLVVDLRRFAGVLPAPVDDAAAAALIEAAATTEAGDLAFLLSLSVLVHVEHTPEGSWLLHCVSDPDTVNVATVPEAVSRRQLAEWLSAAWGGAVVFGESAG
jgi:hypothetical protein